MSERRFGVRVGYALSESLPVSSGVQQGSVIEPLLLVIYSSDLEYHVQSKSAYYVDDTKLYAIPMSCHQHLQSGLEAVSK